MAECAFCRADRKLSREHVWPDWLIADLPDPEPDLRNVRTLGTTDTPSGEWSLQYRDEGPRSVPGKVRVVCRECNNGWMSQLETEIQPLVRRLYRGERSKLSTADQRRLAFWTAKTMVMIEYTDNHTRVTTPDQRHLLYTQRAKKWLPYGTVVWIGAFRPPDAALRRGYYHRTVTASLPSRGAVLTHPRPNFQQTTLVIGHLVLTIFSYTLQGFRFELARPPLNLGRLAPVSKPFVWPTGEPFDVEGIEGFDGLTNTLVRNLSGL